jgi:hypothetical protein
MARMSKSHFIHGYTVVGNPEEFPWGFWKKI